MTILFVVALVVTFVMAAFALLFWKLASRGDREPDAAAWLDTFSLDSYSPMERLLDKCDLDFLRSQPGYQPEIGARLMKERKKIFLGYLHHLIGDFNSLLRIARLMIVYSRQDRAEFAKALWRQQVAFYFAVSAVRVRVALYPHGWSALDIPKLVGALATMRTQVERLAFREMAAPELA
jgi:hypothetical protein